MDDVIFFV